MFVVPFTVWVRTRLHVDELPLFDYFHSQHLYLLFQRNEILDFFANSLYLHAMARLLAAKSIEKRLAAVVRILLMHIEGIGGMFNWVLALWT